MTDEYIKKQDAVMTAMDYGGIGNAQDASQDIASALIAIPAADVRPVVHARWKKSYADPVAFGERPFFRYCSECHEATVYRYNYCPNCGADMREVQDG